MKSFEKNVSQDCLNLAVRFLLIQVCMLWLGNVTEMMTVTIRYLTVEILTGVGMTGMGKSEE